MYLNFLVVKIFIFRCMMDGDDEVRDRATFYYHVLNKEDKQLSSSYILNSMIFFFAFSTFIYHVLIQVTQGW